MRIKDLEPIHIDGPRLLQVAVDAAGSAWRIRKEISLARYRFDEEAKTKARAILDHIAQRRNQIVEQSML